MYQVITERLTSLVSSYDSQTAKLAFLKLISFNLHDRTKKLDILMLTLTWRGNFRWGKCWGGGIRGLTQLEGKLLEGKLLAGNIRGTVHWVELEQGACPS